MNQQILIVPVLLPIIAGIWMIVFKPKKKSYSPLFIEGIVLLNSILVWVIIFTGMGRDQGAIFFRLTY
jgi:hypothetical protein